MCNKVEIVGSITLPLKMSLTLEGDIPPLYESLYADKLFSFNNSIILNFIASGNNTILPTFQKKYNKLFGENIWKFPNKIVKKYK